MGKFALCMGTSDLWRNVTWTRALMMCYAIKFDQLANQIIKSDSREREGEVKKMHCSK